jgi:mannitol-1-phosphate 5-dehydrogenase
VLPALARGLLAREGVEAGEARPLDLVIAENDREAKDTVRSGLAPFLPAGFPLDRRLGLVETSIGKMVPIMRKEDLAVDRLRVFAEAYDELIVDASGFLGPLPEARGIHPVANIRAYVDRKLFVHNLGHAAVAYLGFEADPSESLISKALRLAGVEDAARRAMSEAAAALVLEYPMDLSASALDAHIDDLLRRFGNGVLGDTVYRVGRDLPRKLGKADRVIGAALLCERHGLRWDAIAELFGAALRFDARDESGAAFPPDTAFRGGMAAGGSEYVLGEACGLGIDGGTEERVRRNLNARFWRDSGPARP